MPGLDEFLTSDGLFGSNSFKSPGGDTVFREKNYRMQVANSIVSKFGLKAIAGDRLRVPISSFAPCFRAIKQRISVAASEIANESRDIDFSSYIKLFGLNCDAPVFIEGVIESLISHADKISADNQTWQPSAFHSRMVEKASRLIDKEFAAKSLHEALGKPAGSPIMNSEMLIACGECERKKKAQKMRQREGDYEKSVPLERPLKASNLIERPAIEKPVSIEKPVPIEKRHHRPDEYEEWRVPKGRVSEGLPRLEERTFASRSGPFEIKSYTRETNTRTPGLADFSSVLSKPASVSAHKPSLADFSSMFMPSAEDSIQSNAESESHIIVSTQRATDSPPSLADFSSMFSPDATTLDGPFSKLKNKVLKTKPDGKKKDKSKDKSKKDKPKKDKSDKPKKDKSASKEASYEKQRAKDEKARERARMQEMEATRERERMRAAERERDRQHELELERVRTDRERARQEAERAREDAARASRSTVSGPAKLTEDPTCPIPDRGYSDEYIEGMYRRAGKMRPARPATVHKVRPGVPPLGLFKDVEVSSKSVPLEQRPVETALGPCQQEFVKQLQDKIDFFEAGYDNVFIPDEAELAKVKSFAESKGFKVSYINLCRNHVAKIGENGLFLFMNSDTAIPVRSSDGSLESVKHIIGVSSKIISSKQMQIGNRSVKVWIHSQIFALPPK